MDIATPPTKKVAKKQIKSALGDGALTTRKGMLDHIFTMAFSGLVYPQIWEDPEVDLEALRIGPDNHVVTIASGGCNVMSYLTAGPQRITAVDLNPAHVAMTRLKLGAARHLPDYSSFRQFFGEAGRRENIKLYDRYLRRNLDPQTQSYWQRRRFGRRRIRMFGGNVYANGLLGRFIGAAHALAKVYRTDPRVMLTAKSLEEQTEIFDKRIDPLFDKRFLRWLTGRTVSLYGLGIPPAQYAALAGDRHMADVLRGRLRRLACDFDLNDNYFAHQAFGRRYGDAAALPLYLRADKHVALQSAKTKISVLHKSMTDFLAVQPAESVDRVVLLDAQDWMNDDQLNALWCEITRTAAPGARVIFRTAGEEDILPGRVEAGILDHWTYDAETSRGCHDRDRSAIYGGFHLYVLKGAEQ